MTTPTRSNASPFLLVIVSCLIGACGQGSGDADSDASGAGASAGTGSASGDSGGSSNGGGGVLSPAEGGKLEDCPAYKPGNNLDVCTMTYLTAGSDAGAVAIDVHPDGSIVYAGPLRADSWGKTPVELLGGGAFGVARLAPDGRSVLSVTRLGDAVTDVAVSSAEGVIAVSGDFGVVLLSPDATEVLWSESFESPGAFVDIGANGTVAVAHGDRVSVFDEAGAPLGDFSMGESTSFNDMALDEASGLVFVTGYKQRDVGGECMGKYKAGYLRAFDFSGELVWKNYDWQAAEVDAVGDCSDTTGRGLKMAADGNLYYVGTSDGGNTVHRKDPKDLDQNEPNNIKTDKYQDPWGLSGAKTIGYFARMDPETGDVLAGTMLLTRLSSDPNAGNSAKPLTIDADAAGNVLVGGATACCVPDGGEKTINETIPVFDESYLGGGLLLVMSPDFTERRTWTGVRGVSGNLEEVRRVAVGENGAWVALTVQESNQEGERPIDSPLITVNGLQMQPGAGAIESHLTVFRGPE